jgi:hypothetical protein
MQITDTELAKENALESLKWLKENIDKKAIYIAMAKLINLKLCRDLF